MKTISYFLISLSIYFLTTSVSCKNNQMSSLNKLIKSIRSNNPPDSEPWTEQHVSNLSPAFIVPQHSSIEADMIHKLPGQPEVDFDQYAGYVTVDAKAGRELFYYFVESPQNSSTKPLLLWLNGGPGCSSLGFGALAELGPFRVNSDGETLYRNEYAWNNVANMIFLESPAGVGFSYSNSSSDYTTGDMRTAEDSYTFLINWLERFPQYKMRSFFITGESYAGHYIPQLASLVLSENKKRNETVINLKGIVIGNAWIDDATSYQGMYDYYWSHAMNSDETHEGLKEYCDFNSRNFSAKCIELLDQGDTESGHIDMYNIYAPLCDDSTTKSGSPPSVKNFDPCSDDYIYSYLNRADVQYALHARVTSWSHCGGVRWTDRPKTVLPIISRLSDAIRVWIYSGDIDGVVPITSTRYSLNKLKLPVETAWRPWYCNKEVGGYVVGYEGVVLATVRGAGHEVPSYQPDRSLVMISSFLRGELPPPLAKFNPPNMTKS